MLDQVLDLFGLIPHHDLGIGRDRQTLAGVTERALCGLDGLIGEEKPDLMVVQGDATSTFAGALAGLLSPGPGGPPGGGPPYRQCVLALPEKINRRLTTQLTALHRPGDRRPEPEERQHRLRRRDLHR